MGRSRTRIAEGLRSLRKRRAWTQVMLANELGLSQGRLSEIERGEGSLSAEQLLHVLALFNVTLAELGLLPSNAEAEVQNALARSGARHLVESVQSAATDDDLDALVRDVLASGSPRWVAALAPVLVRNADAGLLNRLRARSSEAGHARRFGWLLENVHAALESELVESLPAAVARHYRRIQVVVELVLESLERESSPLDALDPTIRSKKALEEVREESSEISRRWGIVSGLQPQHFAEALKASREVD